MIRFSRLLAVVVWVGGLVFFAFVLAPTAFRTLPNVHEAGLIVGAALRVFDVLALVCGGVFLAGTAVLYRRAEGRLRSIYKLEALLTAAMVLATIYIHMGLLPAMDRDRVQAGGDINSVAKTDPARMNFDKLHARSEQVEGAVLLLGLGVLFPLALEQTRESKRLEAALP